MKITSQIRFLYKLILHFRWTLSKDEYKLGLNKLLIQIHKASYNQALDDMEKYLPTINHSWISSNHVETVVKQLRK